MIVTKTDGTAYTPEEMTELTLLWADRVERGEFSEGVTGLGTIREMTDAGDEPLMYPVLADLDVLPQLSREEQFVIRYLEAHTAQQVALGRSVVAGSHQEGHMAVAAYDPTRSFMPTQPSHLVTIRTAGG